MKGTVKWFDEMKLFGYITPDDGSQVLFFSYRNYHTKNFQTFREGQQVEYEILQDGGGAKANEVRLVE